MLERIWLILIFVLGGLVPPMYAARAASDAEGAMPCAMVCCADGCFCSDCPCASGEEEPLPSDPAVPVQPEREQKRSAEPTCSYGDMVGVREPEPRSAGEAREASEARWPVGRRLESVFCVWRI